MSVEDFPVPTRPCAPWCTDAGGDDHVGMAPEDRWCWTDLKRVPMTLAKPVQIGDRWVFDWLELGLVRREQLVPGSTEVLIHNEGGSEWFLALDEARQVRNLLSELIDLATAHYANDNEGRMCGE